MPRQETLLGPHGGYRRLKSFQIAQLVFDVTMRFCELYVDRFSRTRDQMVQAARSGVQNIAEGSQASATSKKTELKLTGVARASLEELRCDYEDFLRQRGLPKWPPGHPTLVRFRARRCATLADVQAWAQQERARAKSVKVRVGPCPSVPTSATLVANAALSLLNLACHLLDRQLEALAAAFEHNGGFTERLHRIRSKRRK
ncbi:MAG TPA: four helix bundle suffix domain-containing protein [Terriglobales bacterium]|nr:four helix bundle suffix domain-containing protein [Terriglobales bacterium]